jgi:hypothetical protein
MVAPGFLQNEALRNWLGGVEPAWILLDQKSFEALNRPPSPPALKFFCGFPGTNSICPLIYPQLMCRIVANGDGSPPCDPSRASRFRTVEWCQPRKTSARHRDEMSDFPTLFGFTEMFLKSRHLLGEWLADLGLDPSTCHGRPSTRQALATERVRFPSHAAVARPPRPPRPLQPVPTHSRPSAKCLGCWRGASVCRRSRGACNEDSIERSAPRRPARTRPA